MSEAWIVFGIGAGYVYEVAEILGRLGCPVAAWVANLPGAPRPEGLEPIASPDKIDPVWRALPVALAPVVPGYKKMAHEDAYRLGFVRFPAVVDPTAVVAASAALGEGTIVNAAAVVGAMSRIGRCVTVNRSASVGHHDAIEDYASIGPGAVLAGKVTVGCGAFVGTGAVSCPMSGSGPARSSAGARSSSRTCRSGRSSSATRRG